MSEEYINRLIRCGYSPCNAYIVFHGILYTHHLPVSALDAFVSAREKERGVTPCGSSITLTP